MKRDSAAGVSADSDSGRERHAMGISLLHEAFRHELFQYTLRKQMSKAWNDVIWTNGTLKQQTVLLKNQSVFAIINHKGIIR